MVTSPHFDVLIVGGGHGGAQVAISLRQAGFEGSVAIVSDEAEQPYERPPLSKEFFSGERSADRIRIRPPAFWDERGITLLLSERVTKVDPAGHRVQTERGLCLQYGKLVWAAGGRARCLPVPPELQANVLTVRTLADAVQLRTAAENANRVAVIGGGYIGLEAAAVLNKAGKQVTLLESLDRVLARVAGIELSRFVEQTHRKYGVNIILNANVEGYEGGDRVERLILADGSRIACDLVVAGIGIVPEVGPLSDAGAECSNGVEIDEYCRTSLADIFAIGDCAAHQNMYAECARIRLESVQNAADMAKVVADCIMGRCQGYSSVPWFWSNQYDLRIQTVGLSTGYDQTVVRGEVDSGSFAVVYLRGGRVIALDCVNSVKDYVQGKALVLAGSKVLPERLASCEIPLKDLVGG